MVSDSPPRRPHVSSLPPETGEIDASWDDEPFGLELDASDPFGRATVVPEEPVSELARRQMAAVEEAPLPLGGSEDFEPESFPPLPLEPPASYQPPPGRFEGAPHDRLSPATPIPGFSRRNARTNPEPLRPTADFGPPRTGLDLSTGVDSLPPEADSEPPLELGAPGPSIPRSRLEPSGLELKDFALDSGPPPTGSALDLVSRPRAPLADRPRGFTGQARGGEPPAPVAEASQSPTLDMKDRYAVGDYTGALVIAESILETDPANSDAKRHADSCREILTQMYAARLGSLDQLVSVAVPPDQIRWLSLDHRAGFLLSLVDGQTSVEELLDVSGMPRLDALRILFTLVQQRVVGLDAR